MAYAEVLTALADPTRRHIVEALREQPKTVGELAADQPVSRSAVSQHLRVLESARLVSVEPQGNRRVYSIRRDDSLGSTHLISVRSCDSSTWLSAGHPLSQLIPNGQLVSIVL